MKSLGPPRKLTAPAEKTTKRIISKTMKIVMENGVGWNRHRQNTVNAMKKIVPFVAEELINSLKGKMDEKSRQIFLFC